MNRIEKNSIDEPDVKKISFQIVLLAALVASISAIVSDDVNEVVDQVESSENAPEAPIDFLTYNPPVEYGSVISRKLNPENKKTIIYVLDSHPNTMEDKASIAVQRDLYYIFKDFIAQYAHLPMVIENWPKGVKAEDFNSGNFDDEVDPHLGNGLMKKILSEEDFKDRQKIVEANLGHTIVPAGMFSMFSFSEFEPIGSVTQSQLNSVNRSIEDVNFAQFIIDYPQAVPCNKDNSFNLGAARDQFFGADLNQEVVECYCGLREYLRQTVPRFFNDRFVKAPEREMEAAMDYDAEFVVVVAGMNHLPQSLKIMDEQQLNYVIVSPASLDEKIPKVLDDLPRFEIDSFPDDNNETCKNFHEALENKRKEDFIQWFIEDEAVE